MTMHIVGGEVLLASGELAPVSLGIDNGTIVEIDAARRDGDGSIEAQGLLVLPGIVDIHGDAFERQIMPRPGVLLPLDVAIVDTDRQLTANGITTALHAVTYSWEPGLRGRQTLLDLMASLDRLRHKLGCDTRLHLRWEAFNLEVVDEVAGWLEQGRIQLLAFNDHFDEIRGKRDNAASMAKYAERGRITVEAFQALLDRIDAGRAEVPAAIERLAEIARTRGIACASHDDWTPDQRRWYAGLGCAISEFPRSQAAIETARTQGSQVVLGAPNVLRGGSHNGGIDAATALQAEGGDVLASDYYYPALLQAAFRLVREGRFGLPQAWALVSRNPARAAGFKDRGEIATGRRADLVLVDASNAELPRVVAPLVASRPVHSTGDPRRPRRLTAPAT